MVENPVWKERIQEAITQRGLDMKKLSRMAGKGDTFVRDLLLRDRTPSIDNLTAIARALGLTLGYLVGETGTNALSPEAIAGRLKWARENAGHASAAAAAQHFGWPASTYAAHENGQNGLRPKVAMEYAQAFGVDFAWLLTGDGEPLAHEVEPIAAITSDGRRIGIPEGEIAQVDAGLGAGLSMDGRHIVVGQNGETIGALAVTGTWRLPSDVIREAIRAPLGRVHVVRCEGDSMEPRIMDGDFVFIDETRTNPRMPGIFALWEGDGMTIKRVEIVPDSDPPRLRLIPENTRYSAYEREAEFVKIVGRLIGRFTTS